MKLLLEFGLILLVSSSFGDEVCTKLYDEGLQVCYKSRSFTRVIELDSRPGKTLTLPLYSSINNTIAPYVFTNSHIRSLTVQPAEPFFWRRPLHTSTTSLSLLRDSFTGMSELTELFLHYININFNNENPLAPLGSLKRLSLEDVNLTAVPIKMLGYVPQLEDLYLQNNRISVIRSNSFASLKSLRTLSLSGNGITYIESGAFGGLGDLKELRLGHNDFSVLPGIFNGIPKLDALDLEEAFGDHETELYVGVFDGLPKLTQLILKGNKFGNIPVGIFDRLTSLRMIILSCNRIREISPMGVFRNLASLRYLDLSENNITTITPGTFDRLSLNGLRLERNNISVIETDTFDGCRVRDLGLGWNRIVRIAKGALRDIVTKTLDLEANPIANSTSKEELGLPETVDLILGYY